MIRVKQHTRIYGEGIKFYLRQLKYMTSSPFYDWVLKKGKWFGKLSRQAVAKEVKPYRHGIKSRQCYYNAQMLTVNSNGKVDYYEGWYSTEHFKELPMEHGFNVYKGKVIDPTAFKKFGVYSYFGVKIPLDFIRKNMVETGMAEAILHKYYRSVKK